MITFSIKKQFLFLVLFFSLINSEQVIYNSEENPLIAILLMVKNEADNVEKTLEPFLQYGLQHFLVLDTGSTDGTINVVRQTFNKYHVQHGHIIEQPFVDFSTTRNYLIDEAEKIFPTATFFLMIDAEWYINNIQELLKFCEEYKDNPTAMYAVLVYLTEGNSYFPITRLFKPHYGLRFEGVVHETLWGEAAKNCIIAPKTIYFAYSPNDSGRRKSAERWHRDLQLLLGEYEKNPYDLRTIFFIAQTYQCLDQLEKACEWYEKRYTLADQNPQSLESISGKEEYFISHYRYAMIKQQLGDYSKALEHFQKAFNFSQKRAEPLVRMAFYYLNQKNYKMCFDLALTATKIPYPDNTAFFIEPDIYLFHRYRLLALSAIHMKQYSIGKEATIQALRRSPYDEELKQLLNKYLEIEHQKQSSYIKRKS